MNPFFKDLVQILAWSVAIVGGGVAVWKGIREMQESTKQRLGELRWKQANSARELMAEIHHHDLACKAVMMLDWSDGEHKYENEKGQELEISYEDVVSALAKKQSECKEGKDQFIRDCFDWFFYYMDRIEHYIRTGLITFENVDSVFRIYAQKIGSNRAVYEDFLRTHTYELALSFWKRYWEAAKPLTGSVGS